MYIVIVVPSTSTAKIKPIEIRLNTCFFIEELKLENREIKFWRDNVDLEVGKKYKIERERRVCVFIASRMRRLLWLKNEPEMRRVRSERKRRERRGLKMISMAEAASAEVLQEEDGTKQLARKGCVFPLYRPKERKRVQYL